MERKGFSSQAKRFTHTVNENPAPGSYLSHSSVVSCSPSISTKGTGGFASRTVRLSRKPPRGSLAPNTYNLQRSLLRQHDFNRHVSRAFHRPIAAQTPPTPNTQSPAPNHYNVCYSGVEVNSVVSAQAAFLSKTKRNDIYPAATGPSPCHYSVKDTVLQKTPKVPSSCFRSTSTRIQAPVRTQGPGPGSYSPYQTPEPVKRIILPRRHYLGLSAPALIPPKDPPLPGPGQYDIVSCSGSPKRLTGSAAFMSSPRSETRHTRGHGVPGPGSYEPNVPTKRSFLYNHSNMWIPA